MEFRREARKVRVELWADSLAQDWQAASIDFAQCWLAFAKELSQQDLSVTEQSVIHIEFFSDAGRVAMYHHPLQLEGRLHYRVYLACRLPWMEDQWYDLADNDESDEWEQSVKQLICEFSRTFLRGAQLVESQLRQQLTIGDFTIQGQGHEMSPQPFSIRFVDLLAGDFPVLD